MHHLSKLLRERRKSLGLTMTEVVQKSRYGSLKKGLRRLWEIEIGSPGFHIASLHQFADALDIPPDEVGLALAAEREWEARVFRGGIEDRNQLHTLIIRHHKALIAHNPWTVVPFATNVLFGDRRSEACIGAMVLLWERADELQPRCDCGDRFYIISWVESLAGCQINGFCPGCHTHQETFGRSGQECFDMLKAHLDDTDFHMSRSRFPHAIRPASKEVLAALVALGVSGVSPDGRGRTRAFVV